jgi:predicted DNA-binding transcriptional regulator AlpA
VVPSPEKRLLTTFELLPVENIAEFASLASELTSLETDAGAKSILLLHSSVRCRALRLDSCATHGAENMESKQTGVADEILNEREAAEFLKVSCRTLQAWRCARVGPLFVRVGRSVRYRRSDLFDWIETNTVAPK